MKRVALGSASSRRGPAAACLLTWMLIEQARCHMLDRDVVVTVASFSVPRVST